MFPMYDNKKYFKFILIPVGKRSQNNYANILYIFYSYVSEPSQQTTTTLSHINSICICSFYLIDDKVNNTVVVMEADTCMIPRVWLNVNATITSAVCFYHPTSTAHTFVA